MNALDPTNPIIFFHQADQTMPPLICILYVFHESCPGVVTWFNFIKCFFQLQQYKIGRVVAGEDGKPKENGQPELIEDQKIGDGHAGHTKVAKIIQNVAYMPLGQSCRVLSLFPLFRTL